jgi:hypothetical protein
MLQTAELKLQSLFGKRNKTFSLITGNVDKFKERLSNGSLSFLKEDSGFLVNTLKAKCVNFIFNNFSCFKVLPITFA